MEREVLTRLLGEGLSLEAIGGRTGRHPSTVAYWLRKHGLAANGATQFAPRGGVDRDILASLAAEGATVREMAAALERSPTTIRHWLRRHGLKTEHARHRRTRPDAARPRRIERRCDRHGRQPFVDDGASYRCVRCRAEHVAEWRRRVKAVLVREAGGACVICGYDRYLGALQFHHLDPAGKSFGLSMRGMGRSLERLRAEAAKCVLLCSNCHAEVEGGRASVPLESLPRSGVADG